MGELKALGKPFILVLNSAEPESAEARALQQELQEKYDVDCVLISCLNLTAEDVTAVIRAALQEFPLTELGIYLPDWLDALGPEHPLKAELYRALKEACADMTRLRDAEGAAERIAAIPTVESAGIAEVRADSGAGTLRLALPRELF